MTADERGRIQKYDRAADTYSTRYAHPDRVAKRQIGLICKWGNSIPEGASILEIGCGDGFVTAHLVRLGFKVTAIDFSPRMIAATARRLEAEDLEADLQVISVYDFVPNEIFDVSVALFQTFFTDANEASPAFRRLAKCTRRKLLLDANPRLTNVDDVVVELRRAGFSKVGYRPFYVPLGSRIPGPAWPLLQAAEHVPFLNTSILRHRFLVAIKAEHRGSS